MKIATTWSEVHRAALYPKVKKPKKNYALFENGGEVMRGEYALLKHEKNRRVSAGAMEYLIKIKPI